MKRPSRRAMLPEADLRRWARVSREEGVSIRGQIAPDGALSIVIGPHTAAAALDDDDAFNARLDAFGRK